MAIKNKIICNPVTGQDIKFLQTGAETGGNLLEMVTTYNAYSQEPAAHYHPDQTEDFTVVSGQLSVRLDGQLQTLRPGEMLHIPANRVHAMWNNTNDKTIVNWKVRPALHTDHLLETVTGLATDGKTNKQGMPNLLQVALVANRYNRVFRLAKPPYGIQKIIFLLLTPFAYLSGYRPTYKKYLD